MKQCVEQIARYGECDIPVYDFPNSCRSNQTRRIRLEEDSVVIIEGIHALNPIFDGAIPREYVSKVYVSVKQGIKDNEQAVLTDRQVRLIRRIIRDNSFRGTHPSAVIDMWEDVVAGEMKNIRPYRYTSDFTLNTIHIYESCIMKERALSLLTGVDPATPAGKIADGLIRSLERFEALPEELVPENSLIREFIGGGSYEY